MADKTGENGILYNIHYPMNPEKVTKTGHDYAAVLQKKNNDFKRMLRKVASVFCVGKQVLVVLLFHFA